MQNCSLENAAQAAVTLIAASVLKQQVKGQLGQVDLSLLFACCQWAKAFRPNRTETSDHLLADLHIRTSSPTASKMTTAVTILSFSVQLP